MCKLNNYHRTASGLPHRDRQTLLEKDDWARAMRPTFWHQVQNSLFDWTRNSVKLDIIENENHWRSLICCQWFWINWNIFGQITGFISRFTKLRTSYTCVLIISWIKENDWKQVKPNKGMFSTSSLFSSGTADAALLSNFTLNQS